MINIENILINKSIDAIDYLYKQKVNRNIIKIEKTNKDFKGDYTLVVFPFLRFSRKSPENTAKEIGKYLLDNTPEIHDFNIIKGFLNLEINNKVWLNTLNEILKNDLFGISKPDKSSKKVVIEYSSPNTNKPLHLGHIRNNLIGFSLAKILETNGNYVDKVNLVNDRGIHICKSMLAWQKWGKGETPEKSGKKGDNLVGEYYVKFDKEFKSQVQELISYGKTEKEANQTAQLLLDAQDMLRKWENNDPETVNLWKKMNSWVYDGFNKTYKSLGVDFDKIYYESETYKLGKSHVIDGLKNGIFFKEKDNSVRVDLTDDGLDKKILLRSDGTSVYMTQDIGTAYQRYNDYKFDKHLYVVGNEQNYHFQVLSLILKKMDNDWAKNLLHYSYGMVELPEGKMKSREGTVVDADDLIEEMISTARNMSEELGKLEGFSEDEKENIYRIIGLGALKYFILKVDSKRNMTFNPKESVDFNGNTGPFIQYSYARIKSILRKAGEQNIEVKKEINVEIAIDKKEIELLKLLYEFPKIVNDAGNNLSPSIIANYAYELAKEYNQFYQDFPILKEDNIDIKLFRLAISNKSGEIIATALNLLGIEVPERM